MSSLRSRLNRTLLVVLLPIWLVMALVSYAVAIEEVNEIYDQQLHELSLPLLTMSVPDLQSSLDQAQASEDDAQGAEFGVMLWNAHGHMLYRSPMAPPLALADHPGDDNDDVKTVSLHGERWRVHWFKREAADQWMAVALPLHERDELAAALGLGLVAPAALAALLLVPLVSWAVGRGLRPLTAVGEEVARRRGRDLSRIQADQVPSEVQPLLGEINALLVRLDEALNHEKRFTADASHELRTPLAAAQTQIEVAQGAPDDTQRAHALAQAHQGLARASHLTEQLLALARLDHQLGLQAMAPAANDVPGWMALCPLGDLVREVVAEQSAAALGKGQELSLDLPDQAVLVSGQPDWLSMAVRNVLSNAIKFTPHGGQVHISVTSDASQALVSVQDSGPGLPAEQQAQWGQRFFRADHSVPGAGLGLSITSRVMDIHQGELRLQSDPSGLKATLCMPLALVAPPSGITP